MTGTRESGPGETRAADRPPIHLSPHADEIAAIQRKRRRLALLLAALGLAVLVLLAVHGGAFYFLDSGARVVDPRNRALRPSGIWGHSVGIIATLVMLANFLYPLRKRARWMHRMGAVPLWLVFHVFVGLLTPLTILFHAAFRFNNLIATFTYSSLLVVVTTGIIGRYIYALVPGSGGLRSVELADLQRSWRDVVAAAQTDLGQCEPPGWLGALIEPPIPARESSPARALGAVLAWPVSALRARTGAWLLSRRLSAKPARDLRAAVRQMMQLRLQIEFFGGIKRLLATWRFGHSLLALFLVVVIILHVAVSIAFGYRWIF